MFSARFDTVGASRHDVNMNVTLTPALEEFVRGKVESGDFRSPEEVVREGLRLLRQQDQEWAAGVKSKIDEGWTQAKGGQLRSAEAVRQTLAARKVEWRTERDST
jgi:putative addiction module CopG family antidote